jgi:uncharacterized protein
MSQNRMIFPNLPVRDLKRTMEFFTKLGFEYNPKFTDDKAACMTINEQAHVMLLAEPFFKTFTKRQLCDTKTHVEGMIALSCESRAEVDDLLARAVAAGGAEARDPQDHGFMYARSFYDLDGHQWEVLWMDPKAIQ